MDALNWRKASYSASNGGCVEVAGHSDRVFVRDTQDRTGPVIRSENWIVVSVARFENIRVSSWPRSRDDALSWPDGCGIYQRPLFGTRGDTHPRRPPG